MKALFSGVGTMLVVWLHLVAVASAVPATLHFQGQLLDQEGQPIPGPVDIEVGIWDGAEGGALLYREEHAGTELESGVFGLLVGSNQPSVGEIDTDLFDGDDRWLELTIGGETLEPRQPFGSVPYAFRAEEASRAIEADSVDGIDAENIVSTSGATFTGPIDLVGGNGSANVRIGATPGQPDHGSVSVADASGNDLALLFVDEDGFGKLSTRDSSGNEMVTMGSRAVETQQRIGFVSKSAYIWVHGPNGSRNAAMEMAPTNPNHGRVTVYDDADRPRGDLFVSEAGTGQLDLRDTTNELRVSLRGHGAVLTYGPDGDTTTSMGSGSDGGSISVFGEGLGVSIDVTNGAGSMITRGPSGYMNVYIKGTEADFNKGQIEIRDEQAKVKLDAGVNTAGEGLVRAYDALDRPRALLSGNGVVSALGTNGKTNATIVGLEGTAGGLAAVANADGDFRALMVNGETGGAAIVYDAAGAARGEMSVTASGAGLIETRGPNGNSNIRLSNLATNADHGFASLHNAGGTSVAALYVDEDGRGGLQIGNESGNLKAAVSVNATGNGFVSTLGPGGSENVRLGSPLGHPDLGSIAVANNLGQTRGLLEVLPVGAGHLTLSGPNGSDNVRLTALTQNADHGFVSVHDSSGAAQAMMLVDPDGNGRIIADLKNFVVDHPDQPGKKIVYTALEGPEAAMYFRGVVELIDGQATIELPQHFAALAVPESITVQLTPRSLDSQGVAVETVGDERIEIAELYEGAGSYDVHYLIHAVRRGFENYEPVVGDDEFIADYLGGGPDESSDGPASALTAHGA